MNEAKRNEYPVDRLVMRTCPICNRCWRANCEQGISIEFFGECVVCRFTPQGKGSNSGTPDELLKVADVQVKREAGFGA